MVRCGDLWRRKIRTRYLVHPAWLSRALRHAPEADRRLILGENAARAYRMDVEALAADVERIGLSDDDFSRENAEGWGKLVFAEA